ncbi:MAG: NAD(P)-binding domain-containing protein [Clostridiales bacterium]|nr:NAD(P)-binding domain-containing protein [Clostridiales bacterium]
MRILASDGIEKGARAELEALGHVVEETFYEVEDLKEAVKLCDVLVVRSATKVRQPVIDAAVEGKRLKAIIRGGVGIDNIDHVYAESKGIKVRNTPMASSDAVGELALALMFSCARHINHAGYTMRKGGWEKKAYKGIELMGKTLGIIGYGRIGEALAKRCIGLGMEVIAYRRSKTSGVENGVRFTTLDEVLKNSDFISLHAPSGDKPIIDAETIAKMKNGVVIVNTSRGKNIDEIALLDALNSGKIYAAGLDVWTEEPTKNMDLVNHPRVSCVPHVGASTSEAQKRIGSEIVEIIKGL